MEIAAQTSSVLAPDKRKEILLATAGLSYLKGLLVNGLWNQHGDVVAGGEGFTVRHRGEDWGYTVVTVVQFSAEGEYIHHEQHRTCSFSQGAVSISRETALGIADATLCQIKKLNESGEGEMAPVPVAIPSMPPFY